MLAKAGKSIKEITRSTGRSEKADVGLARKAPPARLLSRLMTAQRVQLAKAGAVTVAAIETGAPALAVARDLMERFHCMLRTGDVGALLTIPRYGGHGLRPTRPRRAVLC